MTYDDHWHMATALGLARRGQGRVWPNPAVGCVLVQPDEGGGRVVGRGWTQPGGRPHAETEALRRAGPQARGATAYVTLEPCAHRGATGPCAEAMIGAGIARAVVAIEDPYPKVAGKGFAMLREAGIDVTLGVGASEAAEINAGFLLRVDCGRPLVALKAASTLDGRIATASGESQWITGEAARRRGHVLRAEADAIMVGIGTALADDPALSCRIEGMAERSPLRIVADSALRTPLDSRLVATAREIPTWIVATEGADPKRREALCAKGVEIVETQADERGRADMKAALQALGDKGLTRVLVEGGGALAASFVRGGLVDRIFWFRTGRLLGADARPSIGDLGIDALSRAPVFSLRNVERLDEDILETWVKRT